MSDATGPVLRARALWEHRLAHDDPRGSHPDAYETTGPDGATLYVRERDVRFTASGAPQAFRLTVALDHAELEALGDSFRGDAVLALGGIAAALVLGAWLQLSLGLSPLRRLQAELARIQQGRAARLEGVFPSEIAPLAGSLNALIERQEAGVRKARERAGDLAHGLKTPLAILAAEARRLEEGGNQASAERLREQIPPDAGPCRTPSSPGRAAMAPRWPAAASPTPPPASTACLALMRRMPRADSLDWRNDLPQGVRLRMDPEDFGEVVGNLLDNARLWARSRVTVSARVLGRACA